MYQTALCGGGCVFVYFDLVVHKMRVVVVDVAW